MPIDTQPKGTKKGITEPKPKENEKAPRNVKVTPHSKYLLRAVKRDSFGAGCRPTRLLAFSPSHPRIPQRREGRRYGLTLDKGHLIKYTYFFLFHK